MAAAVDLSLEKQGSSGQAKETSRRQSRNATVTEVYVIRKRLANDDRSALKCKSEWKSSKESAG